MAAKPVDGRADMARTQAADEKTRRKSAHRESARPAMIGGDHGTVENWRIKQRTPGKNLSDAKHADRAPGSEDESRGEGMIWLDRPPPCGTRATEIVRRGAAKRPDSAFLTTSRRNKARSTPCPSASPQGGREKKVYCAFGFIGRLTGTRAVPSAAQRT